MTSEENQDKFPPAVGRLKDFPLEKLGIPKRFQVGLRNIETAEPGLDGPCCQFIVENMEHLRQGGMLMLGGKIGCGKSFAGYLSLALYAMERSSQWLTNQTEWDPEKNKVVTLPDRIVYYHVERYGRVVSARDVLKETFEPDPEPDEPEYRIPHAEFPGLLMIDDLGREHFTDKGFGEGEWDFFFDTRYANMGKTVITTNLTREELISRYNRRIYDRFKEWAKWQEFSEKSLRSEP